MGPSSPTRLACSPSPPRRKETSPHPPPTITPGPWDALLLNKLLTETLNGF